MSNRYDSEGLLVDPTDHEGDCACSGCAGLAAVGRIDTADARLSVLVRLFEIAGAACEERLEPTTAHERAIFWLGLADLLGAVRADLAAARGQLDGAAVPAVQ